MARIDVYQADAPHRGARRRDRKSARRRGSGTCWQQYGGARETTGTPSTFAAKPTVRFQPRYCGGSCSNAIRMISLPLVSTFNIRPHRRLGCVLGQMRARSGMSVNETGRARERVELHINEGAGRRSGITPAVHLHSSSALRPGRAGSASHAPRLPIQPKRNTGRRFAQ